MLDFEKETKIIDINSDKYPKQLLSLKDAPKTLYVLGNLDLLSSTSVAIVGTRRASEIGNNIAFNLASDLSRNDLTIVSGLADGIDESAHKGGIKKTIAVVAGGFNCVLVARKYKIAEDIIKNYGAIISEYPLDKPSLSYMFLERNRIISGLSKCCIVVEAPLKSGAINTANHCLEQKRKLFAVPWNLKYIKGEGCNNLFLTGAVPIINYKQVLSFIYNTDKQLKIEDLFNEKVIEGKSNVVIPDEYISYYEYIRENSPASVDDIIAFFSKKDVSDIAVDLSIMEIEGYVHVAGNKYFV